MYVSDSEVIVKTTFFGCAKTADEKFNAIGRACEQSFDVACVLLREDFGWHHQRGLIVVLHRGEHRHQRDDSFATANIALQQTIHRRVGLHVVEDTIDDALLRARQSEGKNLSEMLA